MLHATLDRRFQEASMVMSREDVRDVFVPVLKGFGMRRRGWRWYWGNGQTAWTFQVARLRYRPPVGFELAMGVLAEGFETPARLRGNDFPLTFGIGSWDVGEGLTVPMLEDLCYDQLDDHERRAGLVRLARMVCDYVSAHASVEELVRAHAAGELRGALMYKELRWALDREAGRLTAASPAQTAEDTGCGTGPTGDG